KIKVPMEVGKDTNGMSIVQMTEIEKPMSTAILDSYALARLEESRDIIANREIELKARDQGDKDFNRRAADFTKRGRELEGRIFQNNSRLGIKFSRKKALISLGIFVLIAIFVIFGLP